MLRSVMLFVVLTCLVITPVIGQQEDNNDVTIHVVQRGESLFNIALNYNLTVDQIASANGIVNAASIAIGQRLIIPSQVSQPQTEPLVHAVQPGETLNSIAQAYEMTPDVLARQNEIINADVIHVGQVLTIREAQPVPIGETLETVASTSLHTIQSGETLFSIALEYGTTIEVVQSLNEIANPNAIFVGQELVVPAGQSPADAATLSAPMSSVDVRPLVFTEGNTGRVRVITEAASTVTAMFLDRPLAVFSEQGNTWHTMLVAVPVGTPEGIYPLRLVASSTTGVSSELVTNIQIKTGTYGSQNITLPEDRLPLLTQGVEDNEYSILENVANTLTPQRSFQGPMSLPATAVMNAPYGVLRSYNGGAFDRYHLGADFAVPPDGNAYVTAPGRVAISDMFNIRGNTVMIDHGWGVFTLYAHLSQRNVEVGQTVNTGDVVGTVGNTGRSIGPHLHWELWVNGTPVDPMQWVRESFP